MEKTLHNSDASTVQDNVPDVVFFGDSGTFKLISKASSKREGWMKSTKAMQIDGVGCVIQVTTQQGDNIAEALTFVPGVEIAENDGVRKIVEIKYSVKAGPDEEPVEAEEESPPLEAEEETAVEVDDSVAEDMQHGSEIDPPLDGEVPEEESVDACDEVPEPETLGETFVGENETEDGDSTPAEGCEDGSDDNEVYPPEKEEF